MKNKNDIFKIVKMLGILDELIGSPYKYGAYSEKPKKNESEFDCSSLVQYVYSKAGIEMPRSSIFQATKGKSVNSDKLLAGDLLFFRSDRGHYYDDLFSGKKIAIGHVAIYISDDLIIHAKSNKGGVVLQKLSDLQKNKLYEVVLAKRILEFSDIGGWKLKPLSQILDIRDLKWQKKSCGIVSLAMVLNFLNKKKINPNDVLSKALDIDGAYIKKIGWSHKGIVDISKKFGFSAKAYDLNDKTNEYAFEKLAELLTNGPVIVSIHKDFNAKKRGHLIVVSGVKNGKVEYFEPNSKTRKEIRKEIDIYKFVKGFKRRFIFVKDKS